MADYDILLQEYQEYLDEKKGLAALGVAGAIGALAGGAGLAAANAPIDKNQTASTGSPTFGPGDWGYQEPQAKDPKPIKVSTGYSSQDLMDLSLTLWAEARGQGVEGMTAVGHVILNRSKNKRWADKIHKVVKQDKQFSCWNPGDPNVKKMARMKELYQYLASAQHDTSPEHLEWMTAFKASPEFSEFQSFLTARKVATNILKGKSKDPTNGALFYHTTAVHPNWSVGQPVIAQVGTHVFYATDAKAKSKKKA